LAEPLSAASLFRAVLGLRLRRRCRRRGGAIAVLAEPALGDLLHRRRTVLRVRGLRNIETVVARVRSLLARTGLVVGRGLGRAGRRTEVVHDHSAIRDDSDDDDGDDHDQARVEPKQGLRCHSDPLNVMNTGFQRPPGLKAVTDGRVDAGYEGWTWTRLRNDSSGRGRTARTNCPGSPREVRHVNPTAHWSSDAPWVMSKYACRDQSRGRWPGRPLRVSDV